MVNVWFTLTNDLIIEIANFESWKTFQDLSICLSNKKHFLGEKIIGCNETNNAS